MNTTNANDSLRRFILYYEEMEKKVAKAKVTVKKPLPKVAKTTLRTKIAVTAERLQKKLSTVSLHRKPAKKLTKAQLKAAQDQQKRGILGIGLLLVVVSIAFSTFVSIKFVDGIAIYVALAPQIVFAVVSLFKAFSKIYK